MELVTVVSVLTEDKRSVNYFMYICADCKVPVEVKVGYKRRSEDALFASVRSTCAGIFSVVFEHLVKQTCMRWGGGGVEGFVICNPGQQIRTDWQVM
jgi:hypothetical protein